MNKKEYLETLNKLLGCISDTANEVNDTTDFINLLRLQFDIITATYNCSKGDNNGNDT